MEDNMLRPTVMMLVVLIFAVIAKGVMDYLGRRQLIARGANPDDLNGGNSKARKWHLLSNLKWALVLLGFGSAVIVYDSFSHLLSTTGGFGLMFLGAGLGYLVYFFVAWHWSKTENKNQQ